MYKCKCCGSQFLGGKRIDEEELWREYTEGKQTLSALAHKYRCSSKTIQRRIHSYKLVKTSPTASDVTIIIDTTYFGRGNGLMVFMDALSGKILLRFRVKSETADQYKNGISILKGRGFSINGIVCDGKLGLLGLFDGIPTQLCQFHQIQIVRRYLTQKPKLAASIELLTLAKSLTTLSKPSFTKRLTDWHSKWKDFINERTIPQAGKSFYTHKRLRSAYFSLKRNLPWLFTYQDPKNSGMPNTSNKLEGLFSHLKSYLRIHNGLSDETKNKLIDGFLEASGVKK